ncbi:hypothetical protein IGI04_016839 [Brassica rapa subsp. trilocularis]|uniref:Uncharacterized protein n=1 Tax=Brassica rapa subsp. trilocularis TaxID=1813537 RepID=A0ABQ7MUA1_BRACM|nr:hypothetical protein IGI04_016839 [Brassica rapa subsp. trilocularis]
MDKPSAADSQVLNLVTNPPDYESYSRRVREVRSENLLDLLVRVLLTTERDVGASRDEIELLLNLLKQLENDAA